MSKIMLHLRFLPECIAFSADSLKPGPHGNEFALDHA